MRALEAGADALLMPADPEAAIRAVVAAVEDGRLTRRRIQESVVKLLAAKERLGLDRKRIVDLEAIGDIVDSPEANERAQEIADRAVTLVRNSRQRGSAGRARARLLRGDGREPLLHRGAGVHPGGSQAARPRRRWRRWTRACRGRKWMTPWRS